MDSQPSGNNELISIETDNVIFVLKGERYGISDQAILQINPLNMELHEQLQSFGLQKHHRGSL